MSRTAFMFLIHFSAASAAAGAAFLLADLARWQGPRFLLIGLAAALLAQPVNRLAAQLRARLFN